MPHLRDLVQRLGDQVSRHPGVRLHFMEICGTHTTSVFRHGLDTIFPPGLTLTSGPGCPVCVMPPGYIDMALDLASSPEIIIATFGDLVRVPGSGGRTLSQCGLPRHRMRVVYSPLDAVSLARENPQAQVVFLSVGFETTAPITALALRKAVEERLTNFSILPGNRLIPPALRWLAESGPVVVDGFLAPGHVSAITGVGPYDFLPRDFAIPVVIGGFGPEEILGALLVLVHLAVSGQSKVVNAYPRAVRPTGNRAALELIGEFFRAEEALWRGLGRIPESGLGLRHDYRHLDAVARFGLQERHATEPDGCACGAVLAGRITPPECSLFGTSCRPEHPVGPCMVSSEGTCSAHFRFGKGGSRIVPDYIVAW